MRSLMGGIESISAYAIAAAGVVGGLAGAFHAGIGEQAEVDRLADSIKGLTGSYESALPVVQVRLRLHARQPQEPHRRSQRLRHEH